VRETICELYEQLKGTKTVNGELVIEGFDWQDYDQLMNILLQELKPVFKGNFYSWYQRQCVSYYKFRKANARTYDFFCPQVQNPVDTHSIQNQLAVMKFYLYRRANSGYVPVGDQNS
jgi:hypothetical protein